MRITFVLPTVDFSGGTRVVATYVERLIARGHDVTCVSVVDRGMPFRQRVKSFATGRGLPTYPANPKSHLDAVKGVHHVVRPFRSIRDRDVPDADVIISTWWETAHWVAAMSPRKGAKAYLIQHHEALFPYVDTASAAASYRLPMHKIAISRWLKEVMSEEYEDDEVSLVPNSVDTDLFYAPRRSRQQRPTVGFMHSNAGLKGTDIVLRAISTLLQQHPDLRVISFGMRPPQAGLEFPAGAEFIQRPAQQAIRDLYAKCDVWLCGSRSEGFGLPILEAMACRCPVVSTKVGGATDIIEDGTNGYLADIDDAHTLARRASDVLALSETAWQKMSDAAYQSATSYTWDDATDLLEATLKRVAAGHATPAAATAMAC